MPFQPNRVHIYETPPGSSVSRLVKIQPYVSVQAEGHPPIFIQKGIAYSAGGDVVDPLPDWFWPEAERVADRVRSETGLDVLMERHGRKVKAPEREKRKPGRKPRRAEATGGSPEPAPGGGATPAPAPPPPPAAATGFGTPAAGED